MPALPANVPRAIHDAVVQVVAPRQTINTNDISGFNDDYENTRNKVETGRRVVQGGMIAIIVVVVVVVIATCVGGCCVYNRTQSRRRERQAMLNKQNNNVAGSYGQTQTSQFQPTTVNYPINTSGGTGPTEPPPVYSQEYKSAADTGNHADAGGHSGHGGHSSGHHGGS
jgi:hypothetical protein